MRPLFLHTAHPWVLFLLCLIPCIARSQQVTEFGIKPTEFLLKNFEVNFAIGNQKTRYGIFLSYRPSTQNAGLTKSLGTGYPTGSYDLSYFVNKFYHSYTLGLYKKRYLHGKTKNQFLETDIFYRNWSFKNKPEEFHGEAYSFKGLRTENIHVYALKCLIGQTVVSAHKDKKTRPCLDVFGGIGIRYKQITYITDQGTVNKIYHDQYIEHYSYVLPSFHLGIKIGLLIAATTTPASGNALPPE